MFQLETTAIHVGASATDKQDAIRQVAAALTAAGNVEAGYEVGMFAREQQTSTWLGNGIAIPHGTTDTRDKVLKTGVQVFQFPQGVEWGEGQTVWVVIGIAARSDEHLSLLRQLTHVLSDDTIPEQLKTATSAETLRALLMGETQQKPFLFDNSLITLEVNASDLLTLQALNAGRLQQAGAADTQFVSHAVTAKPLSLGQGIWLNDSTEGNLASAVAVARPAQPFDLEGDTVALLITVAVRDERPLQILNHLSDLLLRHQADQLLTADAAGILALLSGNAGEQATALSAEFIIRNEHGLHARPGTVLVGIIKQFGSEITVTNLDGTGKPVNGRSLMKVVALGVKKGHRLRITASGEDAQQALETIGEAIAGGLGEGVA